MRTPSGLYQTTPTIYECEFKECPQCGHELVEMSYLNGLKTVQMMSQVKTIAYRPKRCSNADCASVDVSLPSASWQGVAPKFSIYGYDVIGQIGWERQKGRATFWDDLRQSERADTDQRIGGALLVSTALLAIVGLP